MSVQQSAAVTQHPSSHSRRRRIPGIPVVIMVASYEKTMLMVIHYAKSPPVGKGRDARTLTRRLAQESRRAVCGTNLVMWPEMNAE